MLDPRILPPEKMCWRELLEKLPEADQKELINSFNDQQVSAVLGDWFLDARREQLPPALAKNGLPWFIWVIMAGRGFGKNWSGSHWLVDEHCLHGAVSSAIVAATASDLRKNCLEGPSGILNIAPAYFQPNYKASKNVIEWPNGSVTHLYTSEKPNRLRGPNHDRAWCDELSWWRLPEDVWHMLMFTLRLANPKCLITMTPRPIKIVKEILERSDVAVTRGTTYENKKNLDPSFLATVEERYAGTRLGRQELSGELLMDVPGALWNHDLLDLGRVRTNPEEMKLVRRVIGVDPSASSSDQAAEAGIVLAGKDAAGHSFTLGDFTMRGSPLQWARKVADIYETWGCNLVVAEKNHGGEMVLQVLKQANPQMAVKLVNASVSKVARAEPIALMYEQGRIHHAGSFPALEDELCTFVPGESTESPNHLDACVWAHTELMLNSARKGGTWGRGKGARTEMLAR